MDDSLELQTQTQETHQQNPLPNPDTQDIELWVSAFLDCV